MARGKHRNSKHNRDVSAAQVALAAIEAELAVEEELHRAAVIAQAEVDALKADLVDACADRDHACRAESGRLSTEIAALEPWMKAVRAMEQSLSPHWEKMTGAVHDALGGGPEGFESMMALMRADDQVILQLGFGSSRLSHDAATAIQRAQGKRRTLRPLRHYNDEQKARRAELAASRVPGDDHRSDRSIEDIERTFGTVDDHAVSAVSAWHPVPWICEPTDSASLTAQALGLVVEEERSDFPEGPAIPEHPHATLSAVTRNALAGLPPRRMFTAWQRPYTAAAERMAKSRVRLPITAMPRHPIPADAAALQHWYTAAAWGTALRHEIGAGSSAQSRIAVATQAAVPFWLPPGHTINYADSEPLSAEDRDDIRLPYAQVFLALADPLRLDPTAEPAPEFEESWAWLTHTVADVLGRNQSRGIVGMLGAGTRGFTTDRLNLCDAIAHHGARIEGIVLLADALGRLDDEFAWCITVPAKSGGVLGRWTLPASMARSAFRDQVVNLAAVTAWGDWHQPAEDTDPGVARAYGAAPDGSGKSSPAAPVRVLNVKATTRPEAGTDSGTGAQVAPHIRRGHWRRQRYGPKRSLTRRVRISPVLVNASRGDIGPRVYRLPVVAATSAEAG